MKRVFFFSLLVIVLSACNKDKFQSIPQIRIDSITPDIAVHGNFITLTATVTDKEGDLHDSLYVVKKRLINTNLQVDTLRFYLNEIQHPDKKEILIDVVFIYGILSPDIPAQYIPDAVGNDDLFSVGLIIRDLAGNKSEYVESKQIVLKKP